MANKKQKEDDDGIPSTEIGVLLTQEMNKRGLTIDDIRDITVGSSYETARRYVRGETAVSLPALKFLSEAFGWDYESLKPARLRDTLRVKHGDLLDVAHELDPDLQRISRVWGLLTDVQKHLILDQIKSFVGTKKK